MYLKSIEIHGFKSFANKINFKFNSGITAIVGPNGSGKSNVADAVRWVLGEQSAKQLRGSKMEDIIFSGTQARKPMSYAYVAITFDNSDHALNIDYEEVTVARRVYRSGESEYLMNGNTCRLRDVQELFFDTGIGKEGYSIIGQGQIDKILSGKPEDRRELFDEAAGIVKFKKRKAAAEKELEEEKLNLSRVSDILSEIEKQVGPLKEQSETAREYLRLKEELKKYEINLFLSDYEKNEAAKEENINRKETVQSDIENTKAEYEKIKTEYERLENEINEYAAKIDGTKDEKSDLLLKKESKNGEMKLMEEQKKSLFQTNAHYEQRKKTVYSELEARDKGIEEEQEKRKEVEGKIDELSKSSDNSVQEINEIKERINNLSKETGQLNDFLIGLMNDDASVKAEISKVNTLIEQNTLKKAELTNKVLSQKNFENDYETAVETYNRELSEISERIEELTNSKAVKESEAEKLRERLTETESFLTKFQNEKIQLDSRAGALKDISERYEGYNQAIKKVMERKPYLPGIVGVVADLIEVREEYETAVETALGGTIQNIVTKDEPTAKKLVEYLKENKFGRATFLPLDAVKAREERSESELTSEEGFIGYANKLVKTDKAYDELMKYLLGRIVVCDNINNALKLAKKYRYTLKIVTLEGELLNPGGSISGGAFNNKSNLLGRKRELEEAEKRSKEIVGKVNALTRERDSIRDKRNKLKDEVNQAAEELKKLEIKQNTIRLNLEKEEERLKESKQSYSVIELEIQSLEAKNVEHNKTLETHNERLKDNERLKNETNEKLEALNHKLDEERRLERYANEKDSSVKVENATLESELAHIDETIERLNEEKQKFNEELAEIDEAVSETDGKIEELNLNIKYANEAMAEWTVTASKLDEEIKKLEEEKEKIVKSNKEFFNEREKLTERVTSLEKENFRLENQITRITEQIDEQCSYMWNEYALTVDLAKEGKDESLGSYNAIKKGVSELKSSIKGLGDVNVNAIEQYKDVSERYELYTSQKNDIVEAEEKLKGIIEKLEDEMRKQFEEKFKFIKEEFDVVFKEMFGGGQGTLELMEDEDVLTAGIKINAQPPGKKLQNMMMLSGGERALTAIALLFAIQNLKPSPFCLLDEIEAALDDSNVGRYAKYLHKLTDHTQFIVITHRRGTMASADALYGITMQEKGVSALVSVSLIENSLSN